MGHDLALHARRAQLLDTDAEKCAAAQAVCRPEVGFVARKPMVRFPSSTWSVHVAQVQDG